MKSFSVSICIGTISNAIFAIIMYSIKKYFDWDIQIPLWICFTIISGVILTLWIFYYSTKQYKIHKAIKSFNYSSFGNSYLYKWEYVKNPNGIYGYEPINIQIVESHTHIDTPNHHVYTMSGHSVSEHKIKLIIRLTLMWLVEESSREKIQPILEYLHMTEKQ